MTRGPATTTVVAEYFMSHKNTPVSVDDLCKATKLTRGQAMTAISRTRAKGIPVEAIVRGAVYMLVDRQINNGYKEIHKTDSFVLLEDSQGTLWKAVPIK